MQTEEAPFVANWLTRRTSLTAEQAIIENLEMLRELYPLMAQEQSFDDVYQLMSAQVSRGEVSNDEILDWWGHVALPQQNEDAGAFLVSMGCTLLAELALGRGEMLKAWPLIAHADYCRGLLEGLFRRQGASPLDGQSSAGGNAKAALLAPLKNEIVRILQSPPPGGWKKVLSTAITISERLEPFIVANAKKYDFEDLPTTVERWINDTKHNDAIRQAYLSNKAPAKVIRKGGPLIFLFWHIALAKGTTLVRYL